MFAVQMQGNSRQLLRDKSYYIIPIAVPICSMSMRARHCNRCINSDCDKEPEKTALNPFQIRKLRLKAVN